MNKYVVATYRCVLLLKGLGSETCHVADDRSKVCWAVEADVREAGGVGLGDTLHTCSQKERYTFQQTGNLRRMRKEEGGREAASGGGKWKNVFVTSQDFNVTVTKLEAEERWIQI
ncbi:hypothetical protein EYF80_018653 [Liparis tanakae]|uniref:Uncharacterized protein n=1 Tax=Liparis tanakae TaxID=230148 RepID=A0A4Z2I1M7_9TELE|nr:hypothetical protein EYF80_018653 [Liparis tanakae]